MHQAGQGELFLLKRETPNASPNLTQYEGAPKELKLHQLLVSPIFGLETSDSLEIEKVKDKYRKLSSAKSLTATQSAELEKVKSEIETLPTSDYYYPQEQNQLDLLAEIKAALTKK